MSFSMRSLLQMVVVAAVAVAVPTDDSTAQTLLCAVEGYDVSGNNGDSAYLYQANNALASFTPCNASCSNDPECESFAFGSGACLLYSTDV